MVMRHLVTLEYYDYLNSHSNFEFDGKIKIIAVTYLTGLDIKGRLLHLPCKYYTRIVVSDKHTCLPRYGSNYDHKNVMIQTPEGNVIKLFFVTDPLTVLCSRQAF
jgi:hypothetical protein